MAATEDGALVAGVPGPLTKIGRKPVLYAEVATGLRAQGHGDIANEEASTRQVIARTEPETVRLEVSSHVRVSDWTLIPSSATQVGNPALRAAPRVPLHAVHRASVGAHITDDDLRRRP